MSKNVIIAGSIAAACSGLALVAFLAAPHRSTDRGLPADPLADNGALPGVDNPFEVSRPELGPDLAIPPPLDSGTGRELPERDGPMAKIDSVSPPVGVDTPPPAEPTGPNQPQSHTVAAGDSLGEISLKYYGTAKRWKEIKAANPGLDEGNMPVGKVLVIPVLEPTPDLAAKDGERTYTVQKNDTYFSIAASQLGNGARWKELEKLNRISAENLRPGKVIKLPANLVQQPVAAIEAPADGRVHVVLKGETLGEISQKHYGTSRRWKDIQTANPKVDPENMMPGSKLVLPDLPVQATSGTPGADVQPATTVALGQYTVVAADNSLMDIARKTLGDAQQWKKIQDANPGINAKKLRVGQKLLIPGYTGAAPARLIPAAPRTPAAQPLDVLPPPFDLSAPPTSPGAGATASFQPIFSEPAPPGRGETFGRALP